MSYSQGYGKTINTGSLFAYDTADSYNCFKGKPTTNLLTTIANSQGTQDTAYFKTSYGTETAFIPGLGGTRSVRYCNIYNDYSGGSGACCPNLFGFGSFTVSPSTSYVYQIIYRTKNGYVSTNYMYQYQYGPGGYVGEYGLYDSSRREDLGDGWVHAWGVFTTTANTNSITAYLFHYEYAIYNKVELAGIMLTQGTEVLRPNQFLPVNTTRSTEQSLYNLIDRTPLNLNSVSFDASGSLFFDGTDDNITTGVNTLGYRATYEAVIKCLSDVSTYNMYMGTFLPYIGVYQGNSIIFSDNIGGVQSTIISSAGTIDLNKWYHVVCVRTYDGTNSTNYIYINGIQRATNTFSGANYNYGTYLNIGDGQTDNWYPFRGYIAVAKAYNRSLTEKEIQTNYNTYKARFKLS